MRMTSCVKILCTIAEASSQSINDKRATLENILKDHLCRLIIENNGEQVRRGHRFQKGGENECCLSEENLLLVELCAHRSPPKSHPVEAILIAGRMIYVAKRI